MPETTVAAIIQKEGEILLEKRANEPFKGFWCLPGGHIEKNETVEEAVKREVKEETGLDSECKFMFYQDEIIPEINWHAVVLVFNCHVTGELKPQKEEVYELRWFDLEEALKMKLAFKHSEVLKKVKAFKRKDI